MKKNERKKESRRLITSHNLDVRVKRHPITHVHMYLILQETVHNWLFLQLQGGEKKSGTDKLTDSK